MRTDRVVTVSTALFFVTFRVRGIVLTVVRIAVPVEPFGSKNSCLR